MSIIFKDILKIYKLLALKLLNNIIKKGKIMSIKIRKIEKTIENKNLLWYSNIEKICTKIFKKAHWKLKRVNLKKMQF